MKREFESGCQFFGNPVLDEPNSPRGSVTRMRGSDRDHILGPRIGMIQGILLDGCRKRIKAGRYEQCGQGVPHFGAPLDGPRAFLGVVECKLEELVGCLADQGHPCGSADNVLQASEAAV
jgi:hypothetical protein